MIYDYSSFWGERERDLSSICMQVAVVVQRVRSTGRYRRSDQSTWSSLSDCFISNNYGKKEQVETRFSQYSRGDVRTAISMLGLLQTSYNLYSAQTSSEFWGCFSQKMKKRKLGVLRIRRRIIHGSCRTASVLPLLYLKSILSHNKLSGQPPFSQMATRVIHENSGEKNPQKEEKREKNQGKLLTAIKRSMDLVFYLGYNQILASFCLEDHVLLVQPLQSVLKNNLRSSQWKREEKLMSSVEH